MDPITTSLAAVFGAILVLREVFAFMKSKSEAARLLALEEIVKTQTKALTRIQIRQEQIQQKHAEAIALLASSLKETSEMLKIWRTDNGRGSG